MLKFLLSLICAGAFAAESTLTYTASAGGDGEWWGAMTLPKFNPALGMLKSATITYRLEQGASLALGSLEPFPIVFHVDTPLGYYLHSPGMVPIQGAQLWVFDAPLQTYGGFETNYVDVSVMSQSLTNCVGTGVIEFYAGGWDDFDYSYPWNCEVSFCSWSNWRLSVVYRYDMK